MKLAVKDLQGNASGELEVQFPLIENSRGSQAVHDTVVAHSSAQRAGTHSTKTMGEVAGSGKKPWRQKGTGRARAGSFRSPLWRGGGITHGPKPRDYTKKVNSKVRKLALQRALSERLKAGDVIVLSELNVSAPKTKEFAGIVKALGLTGSSLFVIGTTDKNVTLSARNIPLVSVTTGANVNTYEVLRYDKLVFTRDGFAQVEQRLAK